MKLFMQIIGVIGGVGFLCSMWFVAAVWINFIFYVRKQRTLFPKLGQINGKVTLSVVGIFFLSCLLCALWVAYAASNHLI